MLIKSIIVMLWPMYLTFLVLIPAAIYEGRKNNGER